MRRVSTLFCLLAALLSGAASAQSFLRHQTPLDVDRQLYPSGTRVLIVSVSQYDHKGTWPDLNTPRDVKNIHDVFVSRGLADEYIKPFEWRSGMSKDALMKSINAYAAQKLPPEDPRDGLRQGLRLIVYFAGHGYSRGHLGYLVPPDATDPDELSGSDLQRLMLPQSEFLKFIASLNASTTLVLLDACFSGLGLKTLESADVAAAPLRPDEPQRIFQIITAGDADKTVPDDNLFSTLTAAGLNGAADLNFDSLITGTELGEYLRVRMTEESIRAGRSRQTPQFETYVGTEIPYTVPQETEFASPAGLASRAGVAASDTLLQLRAFRDCDQCPYLRIVPKPPDSARHGYLALGLMDVTVEEYDACFRAGGCPHWPSVATEGPSRKPVTDVSRDDADDYTRWLSCTTGKSYRLPTSAEWQHLAESEIQRLARTRSGTGVAMANCRGCGSPWDGRETAPVGSFRAGDVGIFDLLGNAWQWVSDCVESPAGRSCRGMAQVTGGAFSTRYSVIASLPVGMLPPDTRDVNIGFRVARDVEAVSAPKRECAIENKR